MSNSIDHCLQAVRTVRATSGGTKETSYYTAINNLLDAVDNEVVKKVVELS